MNDKIQEFRTARNQHHNKLIDLLPLQSPLTVLIDPSNVCNFRCKFCPTGDTQLRKLRKNGIMEWKTFEKIVTDLMEYSPKVKKVTFCKDGEPFVNPRLGEMIKYIKQANVADRISTTSNGSLLHKHDFALLAKYLDEIVISVEDISREGYLDKTCIFGDYDSIQTNVRLLHEAKMKYNTNIRIHAKIIDLGLSDDDKQKFVDDFSPITDSLNIDHPQGWSHSEMKDFSLGFNNGLCKDGFTPISDEPYPICDEAFMYQVITFNGDVTMCGIDWKYDTVVGNVMRSPLKTIWNSPDVLKFRHDLIKDGPNSNPACANCDWLKNIDVPNRLAPYRDRMIDIYEVK
jgi:radical SAM protein with 4Fe4S-binding SPASM domain